MNNRSVMNVRLSLIIALATIASILMAACGGAGAPVPVEFATQHIADETGEQLKEVISFNESPGLDNSEGEGPLQVQIEFERTYRHQIVERLQSNEISGQGVRDKLVELYKLPPNDPEGTVQTALCPVSVVIPPGKKAQITVEWTERWASGVINRGKDGSGDRLGNYDVFLGYIEPCSLVNQENL